MKKTEIAYLAGFFDGEGSISVRLQQGKYLRIEVSCSQNTVDVLWMYVRTFKGNVYESVRCYQWKTYGAEAVRFLHAIKPFLIVKRLDAEEAIDAWEHRSNTNYVIELIQRKRMRQDATKEFFDKRTIERQGK